MKRRMGERDGTNANRTAITSLSVMAQTVHLSGWPTPKAEDAESTGFSAKRLAAGKTPDNLHSASKLAGWPTPTGNDALKGGTITPRPGMICLVAASQMAGWPTPRANDSPNVSQQELAKIISGERTASSTGNSRLELTAALAGWSTPKASDHRPGHETRMLDTGRINLNDQAMQAAGWQTPSATDGERSGTITPNMTGQSLTQQARAAGWSTPAARDYRTPNHVPLKGRGGGAKGEQLNNQVAHLIPGASLNGLSAPTESSGLLNPEFSRWLQGIPATWPSCAPTETPSMLRSRLKSSAPIWISDDESDEG